MRIDEKVAEATEKAKNAIPMDEQFNRNKAFVEQMEKAGVIRKVDYNIPLVTTGTAFSVTRKFI